MPRLSKHIWFITPTPESMIQSIDTLMDNYQVEVLLPEDVFHQSATPYLILMHFAEHSTADYELLIKLKSYATASQFIVLGSKPEPIQIIDAYRAGANGYALLPVQLKDIVTQVQPINLLTRWLAKLKHFLLRPKPLVNDNATEQAAAVAKPIQEADIYIQFFGRFVVKNKQKQTLALKSTRIQSLLACLLYHGHKGVSRDQLMISFWPEVGEESARNSLNVAISQLRACLRNYFGRRELIVLENNHYRICSSLVLTSDVQDFQHCVSKKKSLLRDTSLLAITSFLEGVEIYRGDFLSEFKFQEWTAIIRDNLWEHYLFALNTLVSYYLEQEQYPETVQFAKLLLQQDACHELTHRQLMYAYYQLGKRTNALQQYLACKSILQADLNVAPSTETEELYQIIVKQERKKISFPLI